MPSRIILAQTHNHNLAILSTSATSTNTINYSPPPPYHLIAAFLQFYATNPMPKLARTIRHLHYTHHIFSYCFAVAMRITYLQASTLYQKQQHHHFHWSEGRGESSSTSIRKPIMFCVFLLVMRTLDSTSKASLETNRNCQDMKPSSSNFILHVLRLAGSDSCCSFFFLIELIENNSLLLHMWLSNSKMSACSLQIKFWIFIGLKSMILIQTTWY